MADALILSLSWPQVTTASWVALPVRLSIAPGVVECRLSLPATKLVLTHRDPSIDVVTSRLMPGATLELVGESGERGWIGVWWGLERIEDALVEAGFTVQERSTWWRKPSNWPGDPRLNLRR